MSPDMIDAMIAAGLTREQMAALLKAHFETEKARGPRAINPALRRAVLERDEFRCTYCGIENVPLHCDHVQPYSRSGATSFENLVAVCKSCNSSKKDRTLEEWRK